MSEIKIGISTCLLGERVRFDGGHKRDGFVTGVLGKFVNFVPVCPEVELGLGVPREPIQLVRRDGEVRLVSVNSEKDLTGAMRRYAARRVKQLEDLDLSGYILKSRSPSCGMERVEVHREKGEPPAKSGRGLFAEALLSRCPLLPVEEEGRLEDLKIRENFIERVFAYRRLRDLFSGRWSAGDLARFHSAEKLLLLAHDPAGCQKLGRLAAKVKKIPRADLAARYQETFMAALKIHATRGKHAKVLRHLAGCFRDLLSAKGKKELFVAIGDYRKGLLPLVVPIALIRHYARLFRIVCLQGQSYLEPHPQELMLRNHV
ncbi:MAG: DUF1722 domain-containing protein [Planctomycetes bacterium]|nr:DUF1722 domain-containing protein [Planctomycetota bacterium]